MSDWTQLLLFIFLKSQISGHSVCAGVIPLNLLCLLHPAPLLLYLPHHYGHHTLLPHHLPTCHLSHATHPAVCTSCHSYQSQSCGGSRAPAGTSSRAGGTQSGHWAHVGWWAGTRSRQWWCETWQWLGLQTQGGHSGGRSLQDDHRPWLRLWELSTHDGSDTILVVITDQIILKITLWYL